MEPEEVITVKEGTLYRYHVNRYHVGPRSEDDMIVGYRFIQVEPYEGRLVFSSHVSANVWSELDYGEDAEMSRKAIALGLREAGRMKHTGSVQLRMDTLEELRSEDEISDTRVRYGVLAYVYSVNSRFPQEWISRNSVKYNVPGAAKFVEGWIDSLVQAEYLLRHHAKEVEIDGKPVLLRDVYRINPPKYPQVERELREFAYLATSAPLRAFISYSTKDKVIAGNIQEVLESRGVKAFLAHENIEGSEEWMSRILGELSDSHVFLALLTDNYRGSEWTDHEAGYADAMQHRIFPLKTKDNPHGFLGRFQAIDLDVNNVEPACEEIIEVISKDEKLGPLLTKT